MKILKLVMVGILTASIAVGFVSCKKGQTPDSEESDTSVDLGDTGTRSDGLDENGFFKGVKASDIVKLPEYKGIEVPKKAVVADEDDVQEQIDMLLKNYDTYEEITDRAVVKGDVVNIDYVGYIDGKEMDGANTGKLGKEVTVGESEAKEGYIDVNQLIGHMPKEVVNITVIYPEDHEEAARAGKTANFEVTINFIQGDVIKATLTDEIARFNGQSSVDALIADIKELLVSSERFYLFTDILEKATCDEIPQSVIDYIINFDISIHEENADAYGYSSENYLKYVLGVENIDEYIESNMDNYRSEALMYLAAQAIAEIENITVTSDDVAAMGYGDYVEEFGEPYLKQFILLQEVLPTFIVENGVVED